MRSVPPRGSWWVPGLHSEPVVTTSSFLVNQRLKVAMERPIRYREVVLTSLPNCTSTLPRAFYSSKIHRLYSRGILQHMIKTVEWTDEGISMLDQRLLPAEEKYLMLRSYEEVAEAIKKMVVRGAPAIGVSAAMGLALGAGQSVGTSVADLEDDFDYMCRVMSETRPTAVNLFWAIERMREAFRRERPLPMTRKRLRPNWLRKRRTFFAKTLKQTARWDVLALNYLQTAIRC